MALNGGVAYGGGTCGAITGAALALGMLAGRRIADHRQAKRVARELTAELMDAFRSTYGAVDCRDLLGIDLRAPGAHAAFIAGGEWRDRCIAQIEFAVGRMAALADPDVWAEAVARIEAR
jgi:C_GCAxxG_C_C family probable redox protein